MKKNDQTVLFSMAPYSDMPRTDNPVYKVFETIFLGMQKRFWIAQTISMGTDYQRFKDLPDNVKELYTINLGWQIMADTAQTPNLMDLIAVTNNIEVKRCLISQMYQEDNHNVSYSYIVSSMYDNPTEMLDDIEIDDLIRNRIERVANITSKTCLRAEDACVRLLAMEGLSFTSSFLTTMAINHNYPNHINSTFVQIQKIAADEADHVVLFSNIVRILLKQKLVREADIDYIFAEVIKAEVEWIKEMYKIAPLPQLNPVDVEEMLRNKANAMMRAVGIQAHEPKELPLTTWYNRTINIDETVTEQQAGNSGAYVTDILVDDWK